MGEFLERHAACVPHGLATQLSYIRLQIIIISLALTMPGGNAYMIAHANAGRIGTMVVILAATTNNICTKWTVSMATGIITHWHMVTLEISAEACFVVESAGHQSACL